MTRQIREMMDEDHEWKCLECFEDGPRMKENSLKRRAAVRIRPHESGMPVLEFLTGRFTYHSRREWMEHIRFGRILLDHRPALPTSILFTGNILEYMHEDIPEPPVEKRFSILYEDELLLVVNKPADLPCHPAGRYFHHTLWALLKAQMAIPSLSFVNRIDRETSGIVLLAKAPHAAMCCQEQIKKRQAYKRYVAFVEGEFPPGKMEAQGFLVPDPQSAVRKKVRFHPADSPGSIPESRKTCKTLFFKTGSFKGISRVDALPETGRSHQIRATLQGLGYPVVGDKLYGVDESFFLRFVEGRLDEQDLRRLRLPRQALHSAELHFSHPETGRILKFSAPLPADLESLAQGN